MTSDREIDEYVRGNLNNAYHPCGTCRKVVDDMSVVDPQLHVHGIGVLRVADASVMPRIADGNINALCLMIGERAAAMILGQIQFSQSPIWCVSEKKFVSGRKISAP